MIYLNSGRNGYHLFQVYDEPTDGSDQPPPIEHGLFTRADLIRALADIDLHTNAILPDEIDEDPEPALWEDDAPEQQFL